VKKKGDFMMSIITTILATAVALEHLYIFYLETIATQSATTSRVFNMTQEELARPSVDKLFKNQGVYNGLLGLFLLYGLYLSANVELVVVFLVFVVAAASYGALTANRKIIVTQGAPAILALLSLLF
jgi:putative membrane protein